MVTTRSAASKATQLSIHDQDSSPAETKRTRSAAKATQKALPRQHPASSPRHTNRTTTPSKQPPPPLKGLQQPPKTTDGHSIIVNNRRWRATDPLVPPACLAELKHFLGIGRSGARRRRRQTQTQAEGEVNGAKEQAQLEVARRTTGLAKLGLGERGKPEWWNDTPDGRKARWEGAWRELRALHA